MKSISQSRMAWSRRETLKSGSLARLLLADPLSSCVSQKSSPMTANDGTDPCPIPWLDKNGSHNQPTNRSLEPSHIDRFKGRVARCSTFTGMGTGNHVNRLAFGSPTADFGVMDGENWAARTGLTTSQDGPAPRSTASWRAIPVSTTRSRPGTPAARGSRRAN